MSYGQAIGAAVVGLAVLAGTAMGQGRPAETPPGQAAKEPPLKGPRVKPNRPAGLEDRFGSAGGRAGERGIAPQAFIRVLGTLRGEEAPEGLRLNDEQEARITAIQEEFERSRREFEGKGREEMRRRRAAAGEMTEEERRQRAEDLRRQSPRPADMQTRIWSVLTEPQQKHMESHLERIRGEQEKRRAEAMMKRRIEQRRPGGEMAPGEPAPAGDAGQAGPPRERFRRIAERLQQLPPEERERIIRTLEEELDKAEKGER